MIRIRGIQCLTAVYPSPLPQSRGIVVTRPDNRNTVDKTNAAADLEILTMPRIMPRTPDVREALEWIQERLESGATVTVQQPSVGIPVNWTPHRWAQLVDDLHIAPFWTRHGKLLMCIAVEGWDGIPDYMMVDTLEMVVYANR